jgi:hypothetical protein
MKVFCCIKYNEDFSEINSLAIKMASENKNKTNLNILLLNHLKLSKIN